LREHFPDEPNNTGPEYQIGAQGNFIKSLTNVKLQAAWFGQLVRGEGVFKLLLGQ
jgi:hypothetical protein